MKRFLSVAAAVVLTATMVAPAQAAAPTTGSACTKSGLVKVSTKNAYVCQLDGESLKWSKRLPASSVSVTMADSWIKVAKKSDGMTAAFGTFVNNTDKPVQVVAAYMTRAISSFSQLHEVVMVDGAMKMQQKAGGFTIPAKGTYQLKPGADHTMIMGLKRNIKPGELIKITYITSTGARFSQYFLAKVYSGGNETYNDAPASMTDGMSMSH